MEYICVYCGDNFKNGRVLHYHLEKAHGEAVSANLNAADKNYISAGEQNQHCSVCHMYIGYMLRSKHERGRHVTCTLQGTPLLDLPRKQLLSGDPASNHNADNYDDDEADDVGGEGEDAPLFQTVSERSKAHFQSNCDWLQGRDPSLPFKPHSVVGEFYLIALTPRETLHAGSVVTVSLETMRDLSRNWSFYGR